MLICAKPSRLPDVARDRPREAEGGRRQTREGLERDLAVVLPGPEGELPEVQVQLLLEETASTSEAEREGVRPGVVLAVSK